MNETLIIELKKMTNIKVKKRNGKLEDFDVNKINKFVDRLTVGLDDVSASELLLDMKTSFYNKIPTSEIDKGIELTARQKQYKDPNYSYFAARVVLATLYKEVLKESVDSDTFDADYRSIFVKNIKKGVKHGILSESLMKYDLKDLASHLKPERDYLFKHVGIRNIVDRYLLKINNKIIETPQSFYMRVAMGLCINEPDYQNKVKELYEIYSTHLASASTPTLFNSGTLHNQLSSCYLSEIDDSVDGIFDGLWQEARKSKYAGGLGFHVSNIRAEGSHIKGTNGTSSGLIPWLKVYNDMLIACDQAGKRQGSGCAYIEPWHYDIFDFLDLKKPTGEERRRCHDLNTAIWVPDLFYKRVDANEKWSLFCPSEVRDLIDLYGTEFEKRYEYYEKMGLEGNLQVFKQVDAKDLWKKTLRALFETSHPWITNKDNANLRYSNSHEGVLHGSNLCCVTGDQRVPTQHGILTVKELASKHIDDFLYVPGRNGLECATNIQKTIENAPILKVITTDGYEHKVTYDHPLWVVDKGWVEARDLCIGDCVEMQQSEGLWGTEKFKQAAFLMGIVTLNSKLLTINDKQNILIKISENDFRHIDKIESNIEYISNYDYENENKFKYGVSYDSDVIQKCFISPHLLQVLKSYDFNFDDSLKVPNKIWKADFETVKEYLKGLFLLNSQFSVGINGISVELFLYSNEFAKEIQILLANSCIKSVVKDGTLVVMNKYAMCLDHLIEIFEDSRIELPHYTREVSTMSVDLSTTVKDVIECENEDTYCLKVLSNDDRAWTCNGLITKNTEIFLHTKHSDYKDGHKTKVGETAVCNLSSINLSNHVVDGKIDYDQLKSTIGCIIRALDNVIDINFYPTDEARNSNLKHRPIGMGTMGWADLYYKLGIVYDSDEAVELADKLMEFISYHAILSSSLLAKERGKYETYEGSTWSKNEFPIDTWNKLMEYKNSPELKSSETIDSWDVVRKHVAEFGMRNSNVMAIAPNASIAYQLGCEQSIEPTYKNVFRYENKSGNYYVINFNLVSDLKKLGLWNYEMAELIKQNDGTIQSLDVPEKLKQMYKTCFERDMFKLIECNSRRQKWVDQGISFNIYNNSTSLKYLNDIYIACNRLGYKGTYYLRNMPASKIQNVTNDPSINKTNEVSDQDLKAFRDKLEAAKTAALNGEQCEMCEG